MVDLLQHARANTYPAGVWELIVYEPGVTLLNTTYELPLCVCGGGWEAEEGVNRCTVWSTPVVELRTAVQDVSDAETCIALARIVPGMGVGVSVGTLVGVGVGQVIEAVEEKVEKS